MKTVKFERGMSVVEVLILTGILVILLIGGLFAYRYFSNTQSNVRNIATIQGSQSQASFETAKVGGVDFGGAILLDGASTDVSITNFASAAGTLNLTGSTLTDDGKFILVYKNSSYDGTTELGAGTYQGLYAKKGSGTDIFTKSDGSDRVPAVDIPMSTVFLLVKKDTPLSSSAGLKKLPNATKTFLNLNGVTFDVYKM
jgi:hypothetical protein